MRMEFRLKAMLLYLAWDSWSLGLFFLKFFLQVIVSRLSTLLMLLLILFLSTQTSLHVQKV